MRSLVIRFLALFLIVQPIGAGMSASAGEGTYQFLHVEIAPEQKTVKNTETFSINTILRNEGVTDLHLGIWLCSYSDHWTLDDITDPAWKVPGGAVKISGEPCDKNGLLAITLKPNETYKRELSLRASVSSLEVQLRVAFRLGFKPYLKAGKPADV